jgi:hypothetical protein
MRSSELRRRMLAPFPGQRYFEPVVSPSPTSRLDMADPGKSLKMCFRAQVTYVPESTRGTHLRPGSDGLNPLNSDHEWEWPIRAQGRKPVPQCWKYSIFEGLPLRSQCIDSLDRQPHRNLHIFAPEQPKSVHLNR